MRDMLNIIRDRRSMREPFDIGRPIAKPELQCILEAARWAPTPNNMQNFEVLVVDDQKQLGAIAAIPAEMSEAFLRENYDQLSFSDDELQIRKTGMLARMFPAAWTDPEAWSPDSDYTSQLSFLGKFMQPAPLLLIVVYDSNKRAPGSDRDIVGHLSLGCVLENMWLESESLGIGLQVLTVFSNGQVENRLKRLLGIPGHLKIAFACRLGYPTAPSPKEPHVRRDIEDFVHHNHFGRKEIVWSGSHHG